MSLLVSLRNASRCSWQLDGIEDPHKPRSDNQDCLRDGSRRRSDPAKKERGHRRGAAKSSAGAIFKEPICQVPNIHYFTEWAKRNGLWVFGLDAGGKDSLWETDLTGGVALVVGSEGKGLSHLVKERCDFLLRIPMEGRIGSLNASVACGMAVYEIRRQREKSNAVV